MRNIIGGNNLDCYFFKKDNSFTLIDSYDGSQGKLATAFLICFMLVFLKGLNPALLFWSENFFQTESWKIYLIMTVMM